MSVVFHGLLADEVQILLWLGTIALHVPCLSWRWRRRSGRQRATTGPNVFGAVLRFEVRTAQAAGFDQPSSPEVGAFASRRRKD